jgi:PAS domain S-box-containing protein
MGWERVFWLVFERLSSTIFVLDDHRRIVHANDAALALLGRSRAELLGESIVDSVAPSERARSEEEWLAFLRSGEYAGTRTFILADGSEAQVDFAARIASSANAGWRSTWRWHRARLRRRSARGDPRPAR